MLSIGLYIATLLAICFICLILTRRNSAKNDQVVNLPPGSKGLPLIGETLQLLIPSHSLDLPTFIRTRIQRYGPIFQTRLVGRSVVMSADPGFNRYIVQQEGKMVEMWYLDTFSKLFAQEGEARTNAAGLVHKYLRNITLSHFGSESLRQTLLPHLEDLVGKSLHAWSIQDSIDVKEAALTNQKEVMDMMRRTLQERLASPESTYRGDFLDHALKDLNTEKFLTEDFILQIMFGLLFASSESTSMTLTLILKFLSENPHVLEELEAEHDRILKARLSPDLD